MFNNNKISHYKIPNYTLKMYTQNWQIYIHLQFDFSTCFEATAFCFNLRNMMEIYHPTILKCKTKFTF